MTITLSIIEANSTFPSLAAFEKARKDVGMAEAYRTFLHKWEGVYRGLTEPPHCGSPSSSAYMSPRSQ
jgi:hypothetical protein